MQTNLLIQIKRRISQALTKEHKCFSWKLNGYGLSLTDAVTLRDIKQLLGTSL
jgi:hypothetical protein